MDITQKTNERESLIETRSGCRQLAAIRVWTGDNGKGKLFIDGIGRSGRTLRGGFTLDYDAAQARLSKIHAHVEQVAHFEASLLE